MSKNNIDMQKLHLAPAAIQFLVAIGLAAVIVGAGYFLKFQEQYEEIQAAQEQENTLKGEYETHVVKAANLENLQLELVQIEQSIQHLIKQLPTGPEIPSLIREMHEAGAKNGLTINKITPQPSVIDDSIERLPFQISVTGSYDQLSQFVRDIGRMSRIVTLSAVTVVPTNPNEKNKNHSKLTLSAVANTYKAVDTAMPASEASAAPAAPAAQ